MPNITSKIALSIILAGLFIVTVFTAMDYNRLDFNFYVVFSAVVVYIFLFGFAVGQNYSLPIKELIKKANELAKGNLSSRVYLESKDELADLAKVLNKLAEKLEQSKTAVEESEREIDIKVKARTEAFQETITALDQKVRNRTIELEKMIADFQKLQENIKNKGTEIIELKKGINVFQPNPASKPKKVKIAKRG